VRDIVHGDCRSAVRSAVAAGVRWLILCGAFCQTAHAAAEPLPPVNDNLPLVQLSPSVTYDTNVARSSESLAQMRGIVPEDEIYSPAVQLNWAKSFGAETLHIAGVLGYDFYQHNSVLNRENIDLTGGFGWQGGLCGVAVDGAYVRQQSGLQELTVAVTKNTETLSSASLGLRCGGETRLSGFIFLTPNWSENSAQLLQTSNSKSVPLAAGVGYDFANFGKLSVFGEYEKTIYPDRLVELGPSLVSDGYQLYTGGVRWDRQMGQRLKASVALSEISLRPRLPGDSSFGGIGYEAVLTYRATSRLEVDLSSSRAVNPVNRLNTTYSIDQIYAATVAYRLGGRTKLSVDGQVVDHHYFGAQIQPGTDLISQSINSVDARLSYALRPGVALTLSATQEHGTADIPDYRYDDTRAELSLSAAF